MPPNRAAARAAEDRPATREQMMVMMKNTGLALVHWEDRTGDLRKLAVRLIVSGDPCGENLFSCIRRGGCEAAKSTGSWWDDVGYQLVVARGARL